MKAKILLAENDKFFRRARRKFLEIAGYRVVIAVNPQEALEVLDSELVDLVITDLRLTDDRDFRDRSGLDVYHYARQEDIPAILNSSSAINMPEEVCFVHKKERELLLEKIQELLEG